MHTAQVMSMLANIHRTEDSDPMSWELWHPHYEPPEPPEATAEVLMAFGFKPVKQPEVSDGG